MVADCIVMLRNCYLAREISQMSRQDRGPVEVLRRSQMEGEMVRLVPVVFMTIRGSSLSWCSVMHRPRKSIKPASL